MSTEELRCVDGCGQDAATIERLRAERDDWRRECERWRDEAGVDGPFDALVAERDELRERAAKVEALLEGVDEGNLKTSHIRAVLETSIADDYERGRVHAEDDAYRRLRAALAPQNHPRSAVDAPEAPGQPGSGEQETRRYVTEWRPTDARA